MVEGSAPRRAYEEEDAVLPEALFEPHWNRAGPPDLGASSRAEASQVRGGDS